MSTFTANPSERNRSMPQHTKKTVAALSALAALGLGGAALAGAADKNGSSSSSPSSTSSSGSSSRQGGGAGETALTGDTAAKVKAAAEAKVPGGTVLRVETDNGGDYEAHVRKSDGTEVEVKVDKSFAVTAVENGGGGRGGHGGRDGHGPRGGGPGETPLTGDMAAKVKAAAEAKVPGGTDLRVETDNGGDYEAHVRKSDGTEVEVKVDKSFAVTAVEERRGRP
ncbi:MAG: hypothetical protein QOH46_1846 [Solirubrobacteraceae bacterium]|nr:hypothetical protein [Solirubrobacteraceae bacterium]